MQTYTYRVIDIHLRQVPLLLFHGRRMTPAWAGPDMARSAMHPAKLTGRLRIQCC